MNLQKFDPKNYYGRTNYPVCKLCAIPTSVIMTLPILNISLSQRETQRCHLTNNELLPIGAPYPVMPTYIGLQSTLV